MTSDSQATTCERQGYSFTEKYYYCWLLFTVSLLFDLLTNTDDTDSYLEEGCILLVVRPVQISGKNTAKEFIHWKPPQWYVDLLLHYSIAWLQSQFIVVEAVTIAT